MGKLAFIFCAAMLASATVRADTVTYSTSGSQLFCNGVAGCVRDSSTSLIIDGLTVSYFDAGANVVTPSIVNFGSIVVTGTGTNVDLTELQLELVIDLTSLGLSDSLTGGISGLLSTTNSDATLSFSPANTTTGFGTLPGVELGGYTLQVLNPTLDLLAPTVGNPVGQTSIQGDITGSAATSVPEPASLALIGVALAGMGFVRRKRSS